MSDRVRKMRDDGKSLTRGRAIHHTTPGRMDSGLRFRMLCALVAVAVLANGVGTGAFSVSGGGLSVANPGAMAARAGAGRSLCVQLYSSTLSGSSFTTSAAFSTVPELSRKSPGRALQVGGGLRGAKALGGGAALKSTLRKYGLAAAVTHTSGWLSWSVLLYTALGYVSARPILSRSGQSAAGSVWRVYASLIACNHNGTSAYVWAWAVPHSLSLVTYDHTASCHLLNSACTHRKSCNACVCMRVTHIYVVNDAR
jgi:hypothetical protein